MNYLDIYKNATGLSWNRDMFEIHHIDKNRKNNDISNLVLIPTVLHQKYHKLAYSMNIVINETYLQEDNIQFIQLTDFSVVEQFLKCKEEIAVFNQ